MGRPVSHAFVVYVIMLLLDEFSHDLCPYGPMWACMGPPRAPPKRRGPARDPPERRSPPEESSSSICIDQLKSVFFVNKSVFLN